jgi:parvulin-like peptidyl-prolyl isomerase
VAALLAVAATLTLFAFVIAAQPQQHVQIGLTAQAGDVQALDGDTDDDDSDDLVEQQQEQQDLQNMIESEQEAEQQNEAAQQQTQLDEQLASQ